MKKCCEGKLTAYCDDCGANLKSRSLLGLAEDLERRIKKAGETRQKWATTATLPGDEASATKARRGLARAEETIHRLACWLELLKANMAA